MADTPSAPQQVVPSWQSEPVLHVATLDKLQSAVGPETMAILVNSACQGLRDSLSDIATVTKDGNLPQIKRIAHKIGGLAAQFGALRAGALAQEIETHAEILDDVRIQVKSLETCGNDAIVMLKDFAAKMAVA